VLAISDERLTSVSFAIARSFAEALALAGPDAIVAIDVPIGLLGCGPRACDVAARKLLGRPRASSVFPAPCRAALDAASYREASARSYAATGRYLQKQLYNILPKIREVDCAIPPELQTRVHEAHPEVSFAVLSGGNRGLIHSKRSPEGERERLALLPVAA